VAHKTATYESGSATDVTCMAAAVPVVRTLRDWGNGVSPQEVAPHALAARLQSGMENRDAIAESLIDHDLAWIGVVY